MSNIKELERKLAQAERRAKGWGLSDRARERLEQKVADLQLELADAYERAAVGSGHGRRSRW